RGRGHALFRRNVVQRAQLVVRPPASGIGAPPEHGFELFVREIPRAAGRARRARPIRTGVTGVLSLAQGGKDGEQSRRPEEASPRVVLHSIQARSSSVIMSGLIGSLRTRTPTAAKMALPIAGATTVTDGSPRPTAV